MKCASRKGNTLSNRNFFFSCFIGYLVIYIMQYDVDICQMKPSYIHMHIFINMWKQTYYFYAYLTLDIHNGNKNPNGNLKKFWWKKNLKTKKNFDSKKNLNTIFENMKKKNYWKQDRLLHTHTHIPNRLNNKRQTFKWSTTIHSFLVSSYL